MQTAIDTDLLELAAGELRLALAPAVGGSIASFTREWNEADAQRRLHWLRPASDEALALRNPLGMASFPLLPFCNRIRNGRASFEGREIRFPPNHPAADSPHPLHGLGWQLTWQVVSAEPARAELALEVSASRAWPWRFAARQRFELDEHRLSVTISLTNKDTAAMPAGIGHHPYFPHKPATRLTSRTQAMWRGDAEVMPTTLEAGEAVKRLGSGVVLSELDLDNNFVGWDREAVVEWPADADGPHRSLVMRAQPPLDYFVVYCPRGFDHFCAEPVSQCTDWLNLLPQYGHGPLGGARLAPEETLSAQFDLLPSWG
jgi:aldose 1-epimerase